MQIIRAGLVALLVLYFAVAPAAAKEPHPLDGDFSPEAVRAEVGQEVEFTLTVKPLVAFDTTELSVEHSTGLRLLAGPRRRIIKNVSPEKTLTLTFRVKVLAAGPQDLSARLTVLGLSENEVISGYYKAKINPPPPTQYPTATDKQGREMIVIEP